MDYFIVIYLYSEAISVKHSLHVLCVVFYAAFNNDIKSAAAGLWNKCFYNIISTFKVVAMLYQDKSLH